MIAKWPGVPCTAWHGFWASVRPVRCDSSRWAPNMALSGFARVRGSVATRSCWRSCVPIRKPLRRAAMSTACSGPRRGWSCRQPSRSRRSIRGPRGWRSSGRPDCTSPGQQGHRVAASARGGNRSEDAASGRPDRDELVPNASAAFGARVGARVRNGSGAQNRAVPHRRGARGRASGARSTCARLAHRPAATGGDRGGLAPLGAATRDPVYLADAGRGDRGSGPAPQARLAGAGSGSARHRPAHRCRGGCQRHGPRSLRLRACLRDPGALHRQRVPRRRTPMRWSGWARCSQARRTRPRCRS